MSEINIVPNPNVADPQNIGTPTNKWDNLHVEKAHIPLIKLPRLLNPDLPSIPDRVDVLHLRVSGLYVGEQRLMMTADLSPLAAKIDALFAPNQDAGVQGYYSHIDAGYDTYASLIQHVKNLEAGTGSIFANNVANLSTNLTSLTNSYNAYVATDAIRQQVNLENLSSPPNFISNTLYTLNNVLHFNGSPIAAANLANAKLSDIGDVIYGTPTVGQGLVWQAATASTIAHWAPGQITAGTLVGSLDDLSDVSIQSNVSIGDALVYNGSEFKAIPLSIEYIDGVNLGTLSTGQVLIADSNGILENQTLSINDAGDVKTDGPNAPSDGDVLTWSDNSSLWIAQAAPSGQIGPQGPQGNVGPAGPQGVEGPAGPAGAQGIQGLPGTDGTDGAQGDVGPQGPQGDVGPQGPAGADAVAKTFTVTAAGGKYYIDGVESPTLTLFRGQTYKFDYSAASSHPFILQTDSSGTYNSSTANLVGWSVANNIATYEVPQNLSQDIYYVCQVHPNMGNSIQLYNLVPSDLIGPQGLQGNAGDAGPQGNPGTDGSDGRGISSLAIDAANNLIVNYTDSTSSSLGSVIGPQGPAGAAGDKGDKGDTGDIGPQGPQGDIGPVGPQGQQGAAGTGITFKGSVALEADLPGSATQGDAYLVQDDDSLHIHDGNAFVDGGSIQGPPGIQGNPGAKGDTGDVGPQGPAGADGSASKYLLKITYTNLGVPNSASFESVSGFETSGASVTLTALENEGDPHFVTLTFSQEDSAPISTMIYGYNAPSDLYNVFNHHDSNLMQIIPAAYSSHEELFSDYNNANTSLKIPVSTSATKSSAREFPPLTSQAFIVISF